MPRYIDAESLGIGKANRTVFDDPKYADGWNAAIDILESAPTADVEEVRHGRWIKEKKEVDRSDGDISTFTLIRCSECRKAAYPKSKYCPNCGAKMDLEEEVEK